MNQQLVSALLESVHKENEIQSDLFTEPGSDILKTDLDNYNPVSFTANSQISQNRFNETHFESFMDVTNTKNFDIPKFKKQKLPSGSKIISDNSLDCIHPFSVSFRENSRNQSRSSRKKNKRRKPMNHKNFSFDRESTFNASSSRDYSKSYCRDPNLPKRPLTPFLRFSIKERKRIKSQMPDIHFKETANIAAEKWANLPKEEKDVYIRDYEKDMMEYKKLKSSYVSSGIRRDFELFRGTMKGNIDMSDLKNTNQYLKTAYKREHDLSFKTKKEFKAFENADRELDEDFDFWKIYEDIKEFLATESLKKIILYLEKANEGKEIETEIVKAKEVGDYLTSFVKYLNKNVINKI